MKEAVIVSGVRTAMGKGRKGTLRTTRPDDLGAAVIREALARTPGVQGEDVDDVIMGCAMPEQEQGMNVARICSLKAGLPVSVPAVTVNRFCSSGLQTIAMGAESILTGRCDIVVAGGTESMSLVGMFPRAYPNPEFAESYPDVYLGMGLTAENLAKKYGISREESDQFSVESHQKAAQAIRDGKFAQEILPIDVTMHLPKSAGGIDLKEVSFDTDECPRADTNLEGLSKLRPVFHSRGTVTAGNASQMSDGATAVVVMSRERAESLGLKPLAVFRGFAVAGVEPEIMGIGPVKAVPKVLAQTGLKMDDIDIIELNEAFAVQALSVIKELELPREKVNVNGGAVALGHPLGCTGARLSLSAFHELERRGGRFAMITMCIGGGMGAAGIFERVA